MEPKRTSNGAYGYAAALREVEMREAAFRHVATPLCYIWAYLCASAVPFFPAYSKKVAVRATFGPSNRETRIYKDAHKQF